MRTLSAALKTVLATGGPFVKADLWTITLTNGTVLRWTSADEPLTVGGSTFAVGPPLERGNVSWKLGLQVDQLKLTIHDDESTTINGAHLVVAAWQNLLDFAQVRLDRFVSDTWTNTAVGSVEYFTGIVGDVSVHGKTIEVTVESELAQLKATFPRTYVLPSCANTLYDGVCGLVEANFTQAGTVGASPTATSFTLSGITEADGYYALGKIKFTSGANAGQVRAVKSYVGGVVTLMYPLYAIPTAGDTVDAIAGCDKLRATCSGRFSNLAHFRGFPYVPDPATQYTGGQGSASTGGGSGAGSGSPPSGGSGRYPIRRR